MELADTRKQLFVNELLKWNKSNNQRKMPWKGIKDPYKVWLSEIILQQTRVEQGLKYYENFISTYPDIHTLANSSEKEVFKLWEGLGYYSRCRNLIATSKVISKNNNGNFPSDYNSILKLKGIGPYTAAAISSFAFDLPYAVLDGNVFRVLSRIFEIEVPIDTENGKKIFSTLAQYLLPVSKSSEYNQAIMDFGATVCKPVPLCKSCFFNSNCIAYQRNAQLFLPVKSKKIKIKERWLNYIIITNQDEILIHKRNNKDIWQNLYEFPLIETKKSESIEQLKNEAKKKFKLENFTWNQLEDKTQKLSHQLVHFKFILTSIKERTPFKGFKWIKLSDIYSYPFPKSLQNLINPGIYIDEDDMEI